MHTKSFIWRKGIVLAICLIVSVLFLSCDNENKGNTAEEQKLVGQWICHSYSGGSWEYWVWFINKNGTFLYFLAEGKEYSYKGNYSVSDGKIYFTNIVFTNDNYVANKPDQWVGYKLATTSEGKEQLQLNASISGGCFTGSSYWLRAD